MAKRHILGVYSALLLVIFAFAASKSAIALIDYTDLYITVKDISTNQVVKPQPVDLVFVNINTGTSINLTDFLDENSSFMYRLNIGNWNFILKLNNASTPEIDYSAERTFLVEENEESTYETIYLVPVGAIEGKVFDQDKLVSNADVKFKCQSKKSNIKTDKYGAFREELLPVGQCTIKASYKNLIGESIVDVEMGKLSETRISLKKANLLSSQNWYIYVIIVLIALIITLAFYKRTWFKGKIAKYGSRSKDKKKIKTAKKRAAKNASAASVKSREGAASRILESIDAQKDSKEELNPRARDIMKTLNEREKKITEFLLTQNDYKSTQSALRISTSIPKTSLSRIFQSLESKKVIKVDSVGKLKKIELTQWFLGKE